MTGSVIVAGARTPMGRLLGSLKDFSGAQLGGFAIKAALERAGVRPGQIQYVIMGQVLTAGAGQIPARQAAVAAGIPMDVPALSVNKVCLSGLNAVAMADQLIRAGECEIVVAGGQESMTSAPHLLCKSRSGFKYGDVTMTDHMAYDGLHDSFDQVSMGASTEKHNARYELTRAEQDEFAAQSHQRAGRAVDSGLFAEEITPVSVPQRKGDPVVVDADEGIRPDTTAEGLAALRPAFCADGTITAGSSSPISDGAAAVVVTSRAKAEELGLSWIAEIGAHGMVAGPDDSSRVPQGGHRAGRPRHRRDQRGVRRGRCGVHSQARNRPAAGEPERWRDRAGPPDRGVRRPARAAPGPGAAAARRRPGCCLALRGRRPG
jgi:acetyl-CoA C-acetyltransferase